MSDTHFDAVIIGANIRGLVTAHVLTNLGFRVVLLERTQRLGGGDATFTTKAGNRFEFGMHVLDYMRSGVATRIFSDILDGAVHRTTLHRGIVLRGHLMPYAPAPSGMPQELRDMLHSDTLIDDIGDDLPTRARLSRDYGKAFADLIFDEVLPSFPSEHRHRAFGVDEARLLINIYPWFFPRATRTPRSGDASRAFHDKLRAGIPQQILYPKDGGFGSFAAGFVRRLEAGGAEVLVGADDLEVNVEPGTHTVRRVTAKGRTFQARHYFWAAGWPALCRVLDLPCQDVATDCVVLGSFLFDRPLSGEYQEILVGDPTFHINRLYFPARFRESEEPLLQIEFCFPRAEDRPENPEHWMTLWLEDLKRLGTISDEHEVRDFDFKTVPIHFNSFGMEGVPLEDADPCLIRADSNLHSVVPSMNNLNLNNHVPRTVADVTAIVCKDWG
jgi:protoporphyrinogen oxidase